MNNKRLVNFTNADESFNIILDFLVERKCIWVLPLSITRADGIINGIYDTTGYRRLSAMKNIKASDILETLAGTVECTEICRNFLLFPQSYILSPDNVYVSEDFGKVRFIIVPAKYDDADGSDMLFYIHNLKALTTENGRLYLDTMANMLECENVRYEKVRGFIKHLQREINLLGTE